MEERVKRREGISGLSDNVDGEEGVCHGEASPHVACRNVWDALTCSLPTIEISDADYRSIHLPCDALAE